MGKIIAVCSGSGGVGKSTIALSLAVGAAKAGKRTVLLDASGSARSCDLMLGLESVVVLDMADVVGQQAGIESALYRSPRYEGLRFACASLYDNVPLAEFSSAMLALHSLCDVLVIDLPTGQPDLGPNLMGREDARVVVTRPDDASIRSAERMMQRVAGAQAQMYLAVNRVQPARVRRGTQYDAKTVEQLLDCPLLCAIPEDDSIAEGERRGKAAIECGGAVKRELGHMVSALLNDAR